MKYGERLVAVAAVFVASACERAPLPTATAEGTGPLFAAGVAGQFKSFRVPTDNSDPSHITLGSDGNMWFTESNIDVSQIARIDASGNITEFVVPTPFSQPDDIVAGPDGALWFTAPSGFPDFFIGRVTTDGQFTGFAPPCDNPDEACSIVPQGITSGPDGNIWFTESLRNAVVRLTPSGVFTFFEIPTPGANPHGITVGPDRALWFTEFNGNRIGRIDPFAKPRPAIKEFGPVTGSPDRITAGPDGNLWFTEPFPFDNRIGRITPTAVPVITEFPVPNRSEPRDIVAGPDGNLWFTEFAAEQLSQITPDGVITPVQRVRGGPWGIARGLDGAIWLTQITGNRVARFTLR
jgi:virginiamycin B lyase